MRLLATFLYPSSKSRCAAAIRNTPPSNRSATHAVLFGPIALGVVSLLAGCSAMTSVAPTASVQGLQGIVHGGQQPVAGATIQLIAPGTTGYGSAGTVIVSTTTDGNGNFTLPRPYTCPANSGLVYILATGGNPGAGTNAALAEAAILGPCSALSASTYVFISEVTTVAAAYTLAPFASLSPGTTNIGTSATNLIGLQNAAAAAGNLANTTTGQAPAANSISGVTLPTSEVNSLANILSACVNSGVAGVASTTCSSLFTAATPPGGSAPTDTFQAALDIALNPGNNTGALFALATPSAPFQPTLTSAPGDFTLGIVYNGGILSTAAAAQGIDIDAAGNAWVAVLGSSTTGASSGLVELSPSGVVSPATGAYLNTLNDPQVVAINSGGLVEVVDYSNNNVQEYSPAGATATGFSVANPTSLDGPAAIAIDNRDSSTWITNYLGNTITHISQTGVELTASSPLPAGSTPWGVAIDGSGNVLIADSDNLSSTGSNSGLARYAPTGTGTYTGASVSTGGGTYPYDLAIDNGGNIWTTQVVGPGKNLASGQGVSPIGGFTSNSDNSPDSIAIDGLGRAFVSNNSFSINTQPGTLTVFSNSGTLLSTANAGYGYFANGTIPVFPFFPRGLALDASGNCWITGSSPSAVVELIGIAAPVATPLAVQNAPTNRLGALP